VCIALVHTLVSSSAQYVGESVGWKATNALRADLALHVLELDLGFHKTRTTGELIERIDGDVSSLANFFSRFVVSVIGNFALLLGVLIVVLAEDALAGTVLAAYALVALLVLGRLRSIAVGRWRRVREVTAQSSPRESTRSPPSP
jgi:ATP-binding cassette subfamily B protein